MLAPSFRECPPRASSRRYVLFLLFCSYTVAFIDRGLVSVAGGSIKQDLALSDTQFGLLVGSAFVGLYCLCSIPLGFLADRIDRRVLIAAGLTVWSLMTVLCGLSNSFGALFWARMGVGCGEACLLPAGVSLIASVTPRGQIARSMAIFLMGSTVGNAIALLGGGGLLAWMSERGGGPGILAPWRCLFLLASIPGFLLAGLVFQIREPPRAAVPGAPAAALKEALRLIGQRAAPYGYLAAATACILILSQTPAAWAPLFYARSFGISAASSAMLIGAFFLSSAPLGQWAGGTLIDKLQARGWQSAPLIAQISFSLAALPAVVVLCLSKSLITAVAAYGVFNFVIFAATPAGLTGWQLLSPERSRGLIIALLASVVTLLGIGTGPALVGALSDRVFHGENSLRLALLSVLLGAIALTVILGAAGARAFARTELPPREEFG